MKRLVRGNPHLLVALPAGLLIGVLVFLGIPALRGESSLPVGIGVLVVVSSAVVLVAAAAVGILIGRRLVGDRLEVALREPGGKWRHGRMTVTEDRASFQRYHGQVRIPSSDHLDLGTLALAEDAARRPGWREWWRVAPWTRVIQVDTARGPHELAALPVHLEDLRARLG